MEEALTLEDEFAEVAAAVPPLTESSIVVPGLLFINAMSPFPAPPPAPARILPLCVTPPAGKHKNRLFTSGTPLCAPCAGVSL